MTIKGIDHNISVVYCWAELRCDSVENVYCTLYIQKADENRACQPRWMKTKYLPPGCSHSWWRTGCKSMVACVVLCKWVSNNKQRNGKSTAQVCFYLPQRLISYLTAAGSSLIHTRTRSVTHYRDHTQTGSSTCWRPSPATNRAILTELGLWIREVPPGCSHSQWWIRHESLWSCVWCRVSEWVTTNNGSRVRSVSLPLFATKADLFPRGSRFKSHSHTHLLSHALQRSHIETHAQFTTRVWTARRHFPNPRTQLPWGGNARGWGQGQPQGSRWL